MPKFWRGGHSQRCFGQLGGQGHARWPGVPLEPVWPPTLRDQMEGFLANNDDQGSAWQRVFHEWRRRRLQAMIYSYNRALRDTGYERLPQALRNQLMLDPVCLTFPDGSTA